MRTVKPLQSYYIIDEPGDGTHYEFIICYHKSDSTITITGGPSGARFRTYVYATGSILNQAIKYPELGQDLPYREYENKMMDIVHQEPYLFYIAEHSECNSWTALAALRAAIMIINIINEEVE